MSANDPKRASRRYCPMSLMTQSGHWAEPCTPDWQRTIRTLEPMSAIGAKGTSPCGQGDTPQLSGKAIESFEREHHGLVCAPSE